METIEIAKLKFAEYNPRKISKGEVYKLKRSIKEYGFLEPIIVNKHEGRENVIVGGNQRTRAAIELAMAEVPCVYVDLTLEKEKLLNIALNKIQADWDEDKLKEILLALDKENADILLSGFSESEIDKLLKDMSVADDNAETIPEEYVPEVKPGQIWQLGDHRLMCADSGDAPSVKLLMDNKTCDLILTDPPYGVDYFEKEAFLKKSDHGRAQHKEIESDTLEGADFLNFSIKWMQNVPCSEYNSWYIFMAGKTMHHIVNAMEKLNINFCTNIVWVKNQAILGRADYAYKHEDILYGWKGKHKFYGEFPASVLEEGKEFKKMSRDQLLEVINQIKVDIIRANKPQKSEMHPTMKPVKLLQELIINSSAPGNIVYDPFLGSGSTLIACEKTNRICYGCEIDAHYCGIIIKRWEAYTKKRAILLQDDSK